MPPPAAGLPDAIAWSPVSPGSCPYTPPFSATGSSADGSDASGASWANQRLLENVKLPGSVLGPTLTVTPTSARANTTMLLTTLFCPDDANSYSGVDSVSCRIRKTQCSGSTIVLFAAMQPTHPTNAIGDMLPMNTFANVRMSRASALTPPA